jgi:hypothetical protein
MCNSKGDSASLFDPSVVIATGPSEIPLSSIAPDLVMADLENYKIRYQDLQLGETLGKGGLLFKLNKYNISHFC